MLKKIEDIFATFHDGKIVSWSGNFEKLNLKISCDFLAELFYEKFEYFYIELIKVQKLELLTYDTENGIEFNKISKSLYELNEIFCAEIEICYSKILENYVQIECWQTNETKNYIANNLLLNCENIRIYDQNNVEISEDKFFKISDAYWKNTK